ncbi:hypothetical protein [Halomarina litorea]|uniref:hypothetical protein n=1 Tax=Halomarina litorea TaxID=2961595 RepID=UPI0020C52253|nr:hypothetical protein [Halomarina sp. BCD28]
MSELATDPYTSFYDFRPIHRNPGRHQVPESRPATVLHELGRAGSPCRDLTRGTKVLVACPDCGRTGKVVGWEGRRDFYACDCGSVLTVPA